MLLKHLFLITILSLICLNVFASIVIPINPDPNQRYVAPDNPILDSNRFNDLIYPQPDLNKYYAPNDLTNSESINWYQLKNFPPACPTGYAVNKIGLTLTCIPTSTGGSSFDQNLNTSNDVNFNSVTANYFYGDGSFLTNLPQATPAGDSNQIQFNLDGNFSASPLFTWSFNNIVGVYQLVATGFEDGNYGHFITKAIYPNLEENGIGIGVGDADLYDSGGNASLNWDSKTLSDGVNGTVFDWSYGQTNYGSAGIWLPALYGSSDDSNFYFSPLNNGVGSNAWEAGVGFASPNFFVIDPSRAWYGDQGANDVMGFKFNDGNLRIIPYSNYNGAPPITEGSLGVTIDENGSIYSDGNMYQKGNQVCDSSGNCGSGGTPALPLSSLQFNNGGVFGGANIIYTNNFDSSIASLNSRDANSEIGGITDLSINSIGENYQEGDVLTINQGTNQTARIIVASVDGSGGITGYNVETYGTDYIVENNVATSGSATGTGCTFDILGVYLFPYSFQISAGNGLGTDSGGNIILRGGVKGSLSGYITDIELTNGGSNYNVGDVLTLQAGNSDATVTVDSIDYPAGSVVAWSDGSNLGTGYQIGDTLTILSGDNNCVLSVDDVDPETGAVWATSLIDGGTGYGIISTDFATSTDGNGSGYLVNIDEIGIGAITSFTLTNAGTAYIVQNDVSAGSDERFNILAVGGGTDGDVKIQDPFNEHTAVLNTSLMIGNNENIFSFPDKSGTFALLDDVLVLSGENTYIQFNDNGVLGSDPSFTYDKTTYTLGLGAEGQTATIQSPTAVNADTAGGNIQFLAGYGLGTGAGGSFYLGSGQGGDFGNGGDISVGAGAGGGYNGGAGDTGNGGGVFLTGGNSGTSEGNGGEAYVAGGTSFDANPEAIGGSVNIQGGSNYNGGKGGQVSFYAGTGGEYQASYMEMRGGNPADGIGGQILFNSGGVGATTGNGGDIQLTTGNGGNVAGNSGNIILQTGNVQEGDSGSISFTTALGSATSGSAGDITFTAGRGNSADGKAGDIKFITDYAVSGANGRFMFIPNSFFYPFAGGILDFTDLNSDFKTIKFQDKNGTLALTSDIKPDTNTFTKCGDTNSYLLGTGECVPYSFSATYLPTSIKTVYGTDSNNNQLNAVKYYDNNSYTVNESAGSNPMQIDINFSGIVQADSISMRENYTGSSGHEISVQLWDFNKSVWEEYFVINDQSAFEVSNIPVFDSNDHVSSGNLRLRITHLGTGVATHKFYLDFIWIQKGTTTMTNATHDSLSGRDSVSNHPWALPKADFNTYGDARYYTKSESDVNSNKYVKTTDFNSNLLPQQCPAGTALQSLGSAPSCIAQGSGTSPWTYVWKTTNENTVSDIVLNNDSNLTFNLQANGVYNVYVQIDFNTCAACDFKWDYNLSQPFARLGLKRYDIAPTGTALADILVDNAIPSAIAVTGGLGSGQIIMEGIIVNGANPSTFNILWSQNTSTASATGVMAGSYIKYYKVA